MEDIAIRLEAISYYYRNNNATNVTSGMKSFVSRWRRYVRLPEADAVIWPARGWCVCVCVVMVGGSEHMIGPVTDWQEMCSVLGQAISG